MDSKQFWQEARSTGNGPGFDALAMRLFHYQAQQVDVYRDFLKYLHIYPNEITDIENIPFLPVQFFKSHIISDTKKTPQLYFSTSGTEGQTPGRHFIADTEIYTDSILTGFRLIYGDPSRYNFFALLPSYLERTNSSLVYMAEQLMKASGSSRGGFYLYNYEELYRELSKAETDNRKDFILGVSFGLLEFFERFPGCCKPQSVVMETGGMKGRRKELVRDELHDILMRNSGLQAIHSEYGMTELLSQAYSTHAGIFSNPPWMRTFIGDLNDPFQNAAAGETGVIRIIDLANIHSCAFIATQDIGRKLDHDKYLVLGRMDASELRGCNLMIG